MIDAITVRGGADVVLVVTLRGAGTVAFEATLDLRGPDQRSDHRSASGVGSATVTFQLGRSPQARGRLGIDARAGESPRAARIEVREGSRHVWERDVEIPYLNVPVMVEFVLAPLEFVGGGDARDTPPPSGAADAARSAGARTAGLDAGRAPAVSPGVGDIGTTVPPVPVEEAPKDRVYGVWFGTNRAPVVDGSTVVDFGAQLADEIHYGRCEVFVPRTHRLGETGSPWYKRLFRGDDRLQVQQLETLAEADFWQRVSAHLAAAGVGQRHAVVFIHGYNVEFRDAAIRAAQLGCDLKIAGPMAFFSWASRGAALRYTNDEAIIEESEHDIEHFLVDFATRLKPEAVHVIAHSLGNRAVLRMVDRVIGRAAAESPVRFGQLILAAPDVTPGLFRHVAEGYRRIAERTTIYVSSRDKALALSNIVHGRRRVGDSAAGVFIVDGIDTVVASEIDAGFLGHFAPSAREVLTDVHDLVHRGTPAAERFGLRVVEAGAARYFVIQE